MCQRCLAMVFCPFANTKVLSKGWDRLQVDCTNHLSLPQKLKHSLGPVRWGYSWPGLLRDRSVEQCEWLQPILGTRVYGPTRLNVCKEIQNVVPKLAAGPYPDVIDGISYTWISCHPPITLNDPPSSRANRLQLASELTWSSVMGYLYKTCGPVDFEGFIIHRFVCCLQSFSWSCSSSLGLSFPPWAFGKLPFAPLLVLSVPVWASVWSTRIRTSTNGRLHFKD